MTNVAEFDGRSKPQQPHTVSPPNAVLTKSELADYLRLSERTIDRADLPVVYLGDRSPRYLLGSVLDELKRREVLP
jgi:hypothetical protein